MRGPLILARGGRLRAIMAWACAVCAAGLFAASATVLSLIVREHLIDARFAPPEWWVFLHLWRPMVICALVLGPLMSVAPAALGVWLIRRNRWPRPFADILVGSASGVAAVALAIALLRLVGPFADGA